jgi:hypothetical protein
MFWRKKQDDATQRNVLFSGNVNSVVEEVPPLYNDHPATKEKLTFTKHCYYCNYVVKSYSKSNEEGLFIDSCPMCHSILSFKICPSLGCTSFVESSKTICDLCCIQSRRIQSPHIISDNHPIQEEKKIPKLFRFKTEYSRDRDDYSIYVNGDEVCRTPQLNYEKNLQHLIIGLIHDQSKQIEAQLSEIKVLRSNIDILHQKFDKLMENIEFAPGGVEFSEAAERFERNSKSL